MRLFKCCCGWSYVIGKRHVYGAIYPASIGQFPGLLANTQHMMSRAEFEDQYSDCARCATGEHRHPK